MRIKFLGAIIITLMIFVTSCTPTKNTTVVVRKQPKVKVVVIKKPRVNRVVVVTPRRHHRNGRIIVVR